MQRRVRSIILLPLAGLFTLLAASAQSGNFIISQHGHPVGTANFNFASSPRGYESTSLVRISMKDLDYSLSKTEQLSAANQLVQVQLSAIVNGSAVTVSGGPEAAQLQLKISANGHNSINRLAFRPAAVFLPDFDPGALDTLLALGAAHKMRDLWAVIPKKTGSIAPILLAAKADERGTLDGKPILVHHLIATIVGADTDLFSGPDNQLLQAELPQQGFALVRRGFVLNPPAKAGAPPAQPPVQ